MNKACKWFKNQKILTLVFSLLLIVESVASLVLTSTYGLNTDDGEQLFPLIMATLFLVFFLATLLFPNKLHSIIYKFGAKLLKSSPYLKVAIEEESKRFFLKSRYMFIATSDAFIIFYILSFLS